MLTLSQQTLSAKHLNSVYDTNGFSQSAFESELERVERATEIERQWIDQTGLRPYESDDAILHAAEKGELTRVTRGVGFIARQYLRDWTPERSEREHPFYYSPPYVLPQAAAYIQEIAIEWQKEMGLSRYLSITSLVRSVPYQRQLATQERKVTIMRKGYISSHQVGLAFDIDGCGIVEASDTGELQPVNPRSPYFQSGLVSESRTVLRGLLIKSAREGRVNFVEELPATQEHCFHVALNPLEFLNC